MVNFFIFLAILGVIALFLAPKISSVGSNALFNFLAAPDWTPADEEIALRPIRRLIEKERWQDAFVELEELLEKHKPTYEALHLKAKLLHHFQRLDDTVAALLQMIPLSNTTEQQLVVMELLDTLGRHQKCLPTPPVPGIRQMRIIHELVLFVAGTNDRSNHKAIPPGEYEVEEILDEGFRWLVLAGQPWGNAETCWQAVQETASSIQPPPKKGLFHRKTRMQVQAEARAFLKEANNFIRQEDWAKAMPLLEKAAVMDPDCYEIAYRFVQAAHQISAPTAAATLAKILDQGSWTEDQEQMLKQLQSGSSV